jgi:hypothetical protein
MIPVTALSRFILGLALGSARDTLADSAKQVVKEEQRRRDLQAAKALIAEQIAEAYSQQVKDISEGYIKAIQDSALEIEFSEDESGKLMLLAEGALRKLEVYLDQQNPDGPIIQFLQKRYEEENIKQITGRLYAGHFVNRKGTGLYSIYNKMGYAPKVDRNKPWLSSDKTSQGIGDIVAAKAEELFEEAFKIDLTEEEVRRGV